MPGYALGDRGAAADRSDVSTERSQPKALRHYDRLGVLRPAIVDERSGYRLYAAGQVDEARRIRMLRGLGVPLADVRGILDGGQGAERLLDAHRRRLETRLASLQIALHRVTRLSHTEEGVESMQTGDAELDLDQEQRRQLAKELFNHVWELLGTEDRTQRQDDLMVHAAHASRYLWEDAGEATPHARGKWQISRVYAVLGRAEPALFHARRCLEICETNGIGDFDLGFAYEALARAHAVAGDRGEAERFGALALEQAGAVADREDREILMSDLATLP